MQGHESDPEKDCGEVCTVTKIPKSSIAVVIPTRNRHRLAVNAVKSVLMQRNCDEVQLLVSDNSAKDQNSHMLKRFCEENGLQYVKTPRDMPMTEHWSWALDRTLDVFDTKHVLYLTDRAMLKPGALSELKEIAHMYPDSVLTYNFDAILDDHEPIVVARNSWTGRLFEISSLRLLDMSSRCVFHQSLPRMLNGLTPRSVLMRMKERFGSVFASISPDYCFAYRCLATVSSVLYYDKSLIVGYAQDLSNGNAFGRGIMTETREDFERIAGKQKFNDLTPIPEITLSHNAILQEYCFVKNEIDTPYFPEIDIPRYLAFLAQAATTVQDRTEKKMIFRLLRSRDWKPEPYSIMMSALWRTRNHVYRLLRPAPTFPSMGQAVEHAFEYGDKIVKGKYMQHLVETLGCTVPLPAIAAAQDERTELKENVAKHPIRTFTFHFD